MEHFHVIDDATVILRSKGVYRQTKLYRRGRELFAGYHGGFVRLMGAFGTSRPDVSWVEFDGVTVEREGLGRLLIAQNQGGQP